MPPSPPDAPRYLSGDALERLDLSIEEIVEGIAHLLRGRRRSQAWSAPKASIAAPDGRYMMSKHAETPCIRHDDRSAFVFRGLGLADLALAALACRRASKVWVSEAFLIR